MGYAYKQGIGVAQNYDTATSLYKQSCDSGSEIGCNNLFPLHRSGLAASAEEVHQTLREQGCKPGKTSAWDGGQEALRYHAADPISLDLLRLRTSFLNVNFDSDKEKMKKTASYTCSTIRPHLIRKLLILCNTFIRRC